MLARHLQNLRQNLGLIAFTLGICSPTTVWADDANESPRVSGGQEAMECAWPSNMYLKTMVPGNSQSMMCTGTLIHPRVILYAAHCGTVVKAVFGENPVDLTVEIDGIEKTETNPNYKSVYDVAIDWAYVVLKEPVVGIPVTPIASGCELQELQRSGAAVRFVGFSPNNTMDNYRLKWAKTAISSISEGVIQAGGAGITACPGDSGGPLMGLLPDGSWRTIGVTSTLSGACGGSGSFNSYSRIRKAMIDWVEAGTGIDINPCFDSSGTPTPSLACDKFKAYAGDPTMPMGQWDEMCKEAVQLPAKDFCGVPDSGEEDPDDTGTTGDDSDTETSDPDTGETDTDESSSTDESDSTEGDESPTDEGSDTDESSDSENSSTEDSNEESEEATPDDDDDASKDTEEPSDPSSSSPGSSKEGGCSIASTGSQMGGIWLASIGLLLLIQRRRRLGST